MQDDYRGPGAAALDPADWRELREQGHRMLDDMFDFLEGIRHRPVWQPPPDEVRKLFTESLPRESGSLADAHRTFMDKILPYASGNAHPGFMGWVQGGGTPVGMLAEMLTAGLNANVGGRNQIPIDVEKQITQWMRELFGFPAQASGLFVTGTSMANLIGVLVARRKVLGAAVREQGVQADERRLTAYASTAAHGCVRQAMDVAGLGQQMLRGIPTDAAGAMNLAALRTAIAADRAAGLQPFLVIGTAGSVDIGAIDDLTAIADIAQREELFFHVDGAFGALAMLAPEIAPRLAGIERADSIAFDFHKWTQVQYDAGFVLVRDGDLHLATFATQERTYLQRAERGLASSSPWPCDLGPDLSRGFRALKTWFTFKVYGAEQLGRVIAHTCALARYLQQRIEAAPELELLAPASLNIVCFRLRGGDAGEAATDALNRELLIAIQESGVAAPSSTLVNGHLAIRAAIFNHRTTTVQIDAMLNAALRFGGALTASAAASTPRQYTA
ncbi:MAG: aromatic-L-amino-acid decarboxylase [Herbaspirillum sp.]|jgi:aromatic-L-amino-acid decarboxylase|nr:aromatic-L-amino-acid decarboxylase [Herbaspirillum sp.]